MRSLNNFVSLKDEQLTDGLSRETVKNENKKQKLQNARETRDIAEENSHTKILQHGVGDGKNRVDK